MITKEELAYANWAFAWYFRQQTPAGELGAGPWVWPEMDKRLECAAQHGIDWRGKRVLEPGASEGHVTVGLCQAGAEVTAFDARLANVLKTFCRTAIWGFAPRVLLCRAEQIATLGTFDVVVHFGLLYHLADPAAHLALLSEVAPVVLLDTHTARPETQLLDVGGYLGHWFDEDQSCLAGMQDQSFWLTKDSLARAIDAAGFTSRLLAEDEQALNGPRSLHLLERKP